MKAEQSTKKAVNIELPPSINISSAPGISFQRKSSSDNASGKCAYLMNIYVREQNRNHGIASKIIDHLVDMAKA